jgi:hypothetical protein
MRLSTVPWQDDPRHLAIRIKCIACLKCCWALPANDTICMYGGPFTALVSGDEKDR